MSDQSGLGVFMTGKRQNVQKLTVEEIPCNKDDDDDDDEDEEDQRKEKL